MSSYNEAMKLYAQAPLGGIKKKGKKGNDGNVAIRKTYHMIKAEQNANQLEVLFEVQRRENEAARRIQISWRRTRILLPWRKAVRMMMAIVTIQRRARGMITRNLVAKWFFMRNSFAIEIQARTRRQLSNLKLRPKLAHERQMAIRIQRIARGMLARKRALKLLQELAATRIQALWRGCVDRSRADRTWLNKSIITIQNAARRKLALNRYQAERGRLSRAAVIIQRQFRSYQAAITIGEKLFTRELKYRNNCIKTLVSEAELCNEKIERIMDRAVRNQVKEKAVAAQAALQVQEQVVYGLENDLSELIHQRETLSPRAIEQGFDEELDRNIAEYRIKLTQGKMHCLFHLQREMHIADTHLEHQVADLEDWAGVRNRVEKYSMQEYDDRRHVTYHRDITARRKAKQRAMAEERRAWQVLFYTRDGKPDKKRRPGKPWDASVYAGAERATYCGGANVDLLAFVKQQSQANANNSTAKKKNTKKKKKGKATGIGIGEDGNKDLAESVKSTVEQVSLQTFLDEVKVYEELLDPISSILEKNTGLAPDSRPPVELGWGPEGAHLAEALKNLQGDNSKKINRFGVGRNTLSSAGNNSSASPSRSSSRPSSAQRSRQKQKASSSKPPSFDNRGGFKTVSLEQDALANEDIHLRHGFESSDDHHIDQQANSQVLSRQPSQRFVQSNISDSDYRVASDREDPIKKKGTRDRSVRPLAASDNLSHNRPSMSKQVSFQDMFVAGTDSHGSEEDDGKSILTSAAELLEQSLLHKAKQRAAASSRYHKKAARTYLPDEDAFAISADGSVRSHRGALQKNTATALPSAAVSPADSILRSRSAAAAVEEVDDLPRRAWRHPLAATTLSSSNLSVPPTSESALTITQPIQRSRPYRDPILSMKHQEDRLFSCSNLSQPSSVSTRISDLLPSDEEDSLGPVEVVQTTSLAPPSFGSKTSLSAMMYAVTPVSAAVQEADRLRAQTLHEARRAKKNNQRRLGVIPWELLDEADGMRHRFENEQRYVDFNKKF
jgi:hypothetical protein